LAAGKTGVQVVPVADLRFVISPAQVDLPAFAQRQEIYQAGVNILDLGARRLDYVNQGV
jgi:hypothetical protein